MEVVAKRKIRMEFPSGAVLTVGTTPVKVPTSLEKEVREAARFSRFVDLIVSAPKKEKE